MRRWINSSWFAGTRTNRVLLAVLLSIAVAANLWYNFKKVSTFLPSASSGGEDNGGGTTFWNETIDYQPRSNVAYVSELRAILNGLRRQQRQQKEYVTTKRRGGRVFYFYHTTTNSHRCYSNNNNKNNKTKKKSTPPPPQDSDTLAKPPPPTWINCKQARTPDGTYAPAFLDQCAPLIEAGIASIVSNLTTTTTAAAVKENNHSASTPPVLLGTTVLRFIHDDDIEHSSSSAATTNSLSLLPPRLASCPHGICRHALAIFQEHNRSSNSNSNSSQTTNSTTITTTQETAVLFPSGFNTRPPSLAVFSNAYADLQSGRVHVVVAPNCSSAFHHSFGNGGSGSNSTNSTEGAGPAATAPSGSSSYTVQFKNCYHKPDPNGDDPSKLKGAKIPRFDTAIMLSDASSRGFFHIMVEQFTRLVLVRDFLAAADDDEGGSSGGGGVTIVVQDDVHHVGQLFANLTRQLLGPRIARRVEIVPQHAWQQQPWIYARRLLVPEPTPCGTVQPVAAREVRTVIRAALLQQAGSPQQQQRDDERSQSIVVVRRRRTRVVVNHEELVDSLRAALPGERIEIFDEARLPPPGLAQWAVFGRAKVVVAPHGAGLANLLACAPGTAVVEFLGVGPDFNLAFWTLATSAGLEYHPVAMVPVAEAAVPKRLRREHWYRRRYAFWLHKRGSRVFRGSEYYTVDVSHATDVVVDIVQQRYQKEKQTEDGQ